MPQVAALLCPEGDLSVSASNPYTSLNRRLGEVQLISWFLSYDIKNFKNDFKLNEKLSEKIASALFNSAASLIPAYAKFLRSFGWKSPYTISPKMPWGKVPAMDKKNYINEHNLGELVPGGNLGQIGKIISLSSGSSGQAFFWPRGAWQEIEGALFHEYLLTSKFEIHKYRTLVVVAFSMGSYLAGTYTYNSIRWVGSKGYDLTVVTPGIGAQDALSMVTKLAPLYEQIILVGYPPFIKDLLEDGIKQGIDWSSHKMRLLLASEFFSEKWRDGVAKLAGISDVMSSTTNIYGASEGTLFGWETAEAIFIRRAAQHNPKLHQALFGSDLTPTLIEYNPTFRYFEIINGNLHLTCWSGIPLIKYDLKDRGGILTSEQRRRIFKEHGIDLMAQLGPDKISDLPMVYVLGRTDSAASIYGVLIYPEYIKAALEEEWDRVTGKFTISSMSDGQDNPELNIHIELKSDRRATSALIRSLEKKIRLVLLRRSREYSALLSAVGLKAYPHVFLHSKNDPDYFPTRIKQKWINH